MSFIKEFMMQTVYLGLPDESVRNVLILFQLPRPTTLFPPVFFLFLWYARVEHFVRQLTAREVYRRARRRMSEWEAYMF